MKKLILVLLILMLGVALIGCNNSNKAPNNEQIEKNTTVKKDNEQKVIIMNSVNDPLPPEARNVDSMPSKKEPQQIPNVNLNDPIVITKMPYSEKERP
jgi:type IV secretory pathway VirB10-like protein